MRYRWYYFKRIMRAHRPLFAVSAAILLILAALFCGRHLIAEKCRELYRGYGVRVAGSLMKSWFPAAKERRSAYFPFSFFGMYPAAPEYANDPSYPEGIQRIAEERILAENRAGMGGTDGTGPYGEGSGENAGDGENTGGGENAENGGAAGNAGGTENEGRAENEGAAGNGEGAENGEKPAASAFPGSTGLIREKLSDYDYLMKNFYSVHPTTTAGRDLINAEKFLAMDFTIEKDPDTPQILIYHTHSQEEFSDYPENPEATIVGVGTYLAGLLREKGYFVIHDTGIYDFRDGELDRSQAYTYALDGISGILQRYPSIEVVLDIHRDGVAEGTRLVTEVNGKKTAQIMFFNGTSQTPDGPIEYLPNPNRDANLGFSFRLKLAAEERYPGFTRRIYLKGLRYNLHVRPRSALIEVGAQTNTYAEAKNAMEPLAELLDSVLDGGREKGPDGQE